MHLSTLVTSLLGLSLAASASPLDKRTSRTSAPSGCLTVGSGGQYSTIGAALAALGSSAATACVYVAAGTYAEQLTITYNGNLTMYGETADTSSYHDNVVTIANTISSSQAGSLDLSATVNVRSNLFRMYNINVVNGYGQGAQAVAYVSYSSNNWNLSRLTRYNSLVANADQVGFYGCGFYGYQDTLYSKAGHQYYSNCYIEGTQPHPPS
jgi:pectinesterase